MTPSSKQQTLTNERLDIAAELPVNDPPLSDESRVALAWGVVID